MRARGLNWFAMEILVLAVAGVVGFALFPIPRVAGILSDPTGIPAYELAFSQTLLDLRALIVDHWILAFPAGLIVSYVAMVASSSHRAGT